jgi:Protein of unknown function (DUF3592)
MIGTDLNLRMRRRGSRPAGPVALSLFGLVLLAMAVGFFLFAFHLRTEGAKSAYTQAHGIARQATVVSVQNIQHTTHSQSGGGTIFYTATITASLNPPVNGLAQTTVNVPHQVYDAAGQTVTVLVDPQDPGYAELPGTPAVTAKDWYAAFGAAVVAALLACFLGWQLIKKLRRRRLGY